MVGMGRRYLLPGVSKRGWWAIGNVGECLRLCYWASMCCFACDLIEWFTSMDLYASGWCLSLGVIFESAKVLYGVQLVIAIWIDRYQSYQA
jgi:hypothetical protein